jgi:hypothetical protein
MAGVDVTPLPELCTALAADAGLTALATGGIWEDPSPDHVSGLVVIVGLQASHDETVCMTDRVTELFVIVKAVSVAADIDRIRLAARRLDDVMIDGLPMTGLANYTVLLCERAEPVAYNDPEPSTGLRYEHRGGIYRVLVETR